MQERKSQLGININPQGVFFNVPVEKDPQLRTEEERHAQAVLGRRLEAMTTSETDAPRCRIDFQSDVWDFRPMYPGRPGKMLVLRFGNLATPRLKRFVKFYLRFCYEVRGTRPSTLYAFLRLLGIITSRIVKAPDAVHDDLDMITTEDLFEACTRKSAVDGELDTKAATRNYYFRISYGFWLYCIETCKMDFPVSLEALKAWSDDYGRLAMLEESRIPDIPEEYYQAILSKCLEVVRSGKGEYRYNDVLVAAVIVILTQTGMRISDALSLKTSDLRDVVVESTGEKTAILQFGSSKPTKGHGDILRFDVFASDICAEAFRRLLELRKESPMAGTSDLLVVPRFPRKGRTEPYNPTDVRSFMQLFFLRNLPLYCRRPWPGLKKQMLAFEYASGERPDLWIPGTHQYRVHLCSYLYRKGVSIIIIEKHLAHLSESMYGYYIRLADNRDKLAGFAEKFIEDYVRRGYDVVESEGAKVQEAVLRFLKEKNVSVKASSDDILNALKGQVTVRQKGLGYCVRASFTPCNDEPVGNRLLCTFGMCPNYVTLFHAADATLSIFRDHMSAYRLNLAAGHWNAAAKELSDAKQVAERHLIPQLHALEKEYDALGWDEILRRHPHLKDVVYNLSEIKREVASAMNLEVVKPRA